MNFRIVCVALTLTLAPMAAMAGGCQGRDHQAQSCETGYVWDSEAQGCIKQVTG